MKKLMIIIGFCLGASLALRAQEADTTIVAAPLDSALLGRDIFTVIGPGVNVSQSKEVKEAFDSYVRANSEKPVSGYRIRVFMDNSPQARSRSEAIESILRERYPEHKVYRSFESPNYKVVIGDFRTKDEALALFNALRYTYPTAFIIKDSINYPN